MDCYRSRIHYGLSTLIKNINISTVFIVTKVPSLCWENVYMRCFYMTLTPICEISTLPKHILTDINLKIIFKKHNEKVVSLLLADLVCNLINLDPSIDVEIRF